MDRFVKAEHRDRLERELAGLIKPLPDKRYSVILADPPWRFEPWSRLTGMDRSADNHYPTMTIEEIAHLDVVSIAAADCALFLWATVPMLRQAMMTMSFWNFHYKSHLVWDKMKVGTGYWFRNRHELLLVGTRGKIRAPLPSSRRSSLMRWPRQAHSVKPEIVREMIEDYFPGHSKIELFARGKARAGWTFWGPEAEAE